MNLPSARRRIRSARLALGGVAASLRAKIMEDNGHEPSLAPGPPRARPWPEAFGGPPARRPWWAVVEATHLP